MTVTRNIKAIILGGLLVAVSISSLLFSQVEDIFQGWREWGWAPPDVIVRQRVVSEEEATVGVVEKASPAVVSITTQRVFFDLFRGPVREESDIGTGFIIDPSGTILTNRHVVSDTSASYTVVLSDGDSSYEVNEIHHDPLNDLAILEISPQESLPHLEFGDSDQLKVGQTVIAIGNALGRFSNTVTKGVVSGIGRGLTASAGFYGSSERLENVIQTDAALNPGNSGGPLLNTSGEVVGINVAISAAGENIGFAIPINSVTAVVEEFRISGKISHPFLGVSHQIVTQDIARLQQLPVGAFVLEVIPGSAADKAGLLVGDIILELDGKGITEKYSLPAAILEHKVGDQVELKVDREGETVSLMAVLQEAPTP